MTVEFGLTRSDFAHSAKVEGAPLLTSTWFGSLLLDKEFTGCVPLRANIVETLLVA